MRSIRLRCLVVQVLLLVTFICTQTLWWPQEWADTRPVEVLCRPSEFVVLLPMRDSRDLDFLPLLMEETLDLVHPDVCLCIVVGPEVDIQIVEESVSSSQVLRLHTPMSLGEMIVEGLSRLHTSTFESVLCMPSARSIPLRSVRDLRFVQREPHTHLGPFGWFIPKNELANITAQAQWCAEGARQAPEEFQMQYVGECIYENWSQGDGRLTLQSHPRSSSLSDVQNDKKSNSFFFPLSNEATPEDFRWMTKEHLMSRFLTHFYPHEGVSDACLSELSHSGNLNSLPDIPLNTSYHTPGYHLLKDQILKTVPFLRSEEFQPVTDHFLFVVLFHKQEHCKLLEQFFESSLYDPSLHHWLLVPEVALKSSQETMQWIQKTQEKPNVWVLPEELEVWGGWGSTELAWKPIIAAMWALRNLPPFRASVFTSADSVPLKSAQGLVPILDRSFIPMSKCWNQVCKNRATEIHFECHGMAIRTRGLTVDSSPQSFLYKSSQWVSIVRRDWKSLMLDHLDMVLKNLETWDHRTIADEHFVAVTFAEAQLEYELDESTIVVWRGVSHPVTFTSVEHFEKEMNERFEGKYPTLCDVVRKSNHLNVRKVESVSVHEEFIRAVEKCYDMVR